jgi:hypothetical protein
MMKNRNIILIGPIFVFCIYAAAVADGLKLLRKYEIIGWEGTKAGLGCLACIISFYVIFILCIGSWSTLSCS